MSDALQNITPVILAYDEEPNIARTLGSLKWAQRVFVLDSGSHDGTESICRSFVNVSWRMRAFDSFKDQWEHALHNLGITTDYLLALDADMEVPAKLVDEIGAHFLKGKYNGGLMAFDYRYFGQSLAGSICPPQMRLFRRDAVQVTQQNHGHKFAVEGNVHRFRSRLIHDDRKPLERWVESQLRYLKDNELALTNGNGRGARGYLRKLGLMPPAIGLLAYIRAGGPFKGAAAARYAYERMTAESMLAIRLMDSRLRHQSESSQTRHSSGT